MPVTKPIPLVPTRLELTESSGPVAPPYQYKLRVALDVGKAGITLAYDDEGAYAGGEPTRKKTDDGPLTRKGYETLMRDLVALGLLDLGTVAIAPEKKTRVGISFNRLTLKQGRRTLVDVGYTLAELGRPEGAKIKQVVERLRRVLRLKLPAQTK
jgi:hypothetical protein